jgi:hypothetical protein
LSRTEVHNILEQTADQIDEDAAGYDANGYSVTHGHGRVNACEAVNVVAANQGLGTVACTNGTSDDASCPWLIIVAAVLAVAGGIYLLIKIL